MLHNQDQHKEAKIKSKFKQEGQKEKAQNWTVNTSKRNKTPSIESKIKYEQYK